MTWTSKGEEAQMALKDYVTWLGPQEKTNLGYVYNKAMAHFLEPLVGAHHFHES